MDDPSLFLALGHHVGIHNGEDIENINEEDDDIADSEGQGCDESGNERKQNNLNEIDDEDNNSLFDLSDDHVADPAEEERKQGGQDCRLRISVDDNQVRICADNWICKYICMKRMNGGIKGGE